MTSLADSTFKSLRLLLQRHAVLRGDFLLSSGMRSPYYLDARLVTLSSAGSALVGRAFLHALKDRTVEGVAGLSVGADPIVTAIAVTAGIEGRKLDGLIVRKEAKQHGAKRRIEGPWRDGMKIAVVDDTLTTGTSALEAAHAVEEAGGTVAGVYCLIDREQGAGAAIRGAGYDFKALFTSNEIVNSQS